MGVETLIADYLKENFPIKQMKRKMFFPNDIYYKIPILVFRFDKLLNPEIYTELRQCIEKFQGNLDWTMFESFYGKKVKNYIICPTKVYQMQKTCFNEKKIMSTQEYFSKRTYKYLCEMSIKDIPLLYAHLRERFNPDMKKYFLGDNTIG